MKRAICLMLMLLLLLLLMLPAAGTASADEAVDRALIDKARESVDRTAAIFSDREMAMIYTSDGDLTERVLGTADAWHQAGGVKRAAVLTIPEPVIETGLPALLEGFGAPQGVVAHVDWLAARLLFSVPGILNAQEGMEWTAAASIMSDTDVCRLEGFPAGLACVLLDCGGEAPLALVSFRIKEDGAALISTGFVKPSAIVEAVFSLRDGEIGAQLTSLFPGTDGAALPDLSLLDGVTLSVYRD